MSIAAHLYITFLPKRDDAVAVLSIDRAWAPSRPKETTYTYTYTDRSGTFLPKRDDAVAVGSADGSGRTAGCIIAAGGEVV